MSVQQFDENYYSDHYGVDYIDSKVLANRAVKTAGFINDAFHPKTFLDVGCAFGDLVAALRNIGVEAYGIDISEYAIGKADEAIKPYIFKGNFVDGLPLNFPKQYDCISVIDVAGDIADIDAQKFVKNLCAASPRIIFATSSCNTDDAPAKAETFAALFADEGFFRTAGLPDGLKTLDAIVFEKREITASELAKDYEKEIADKIKIITELEEKNQKNICKINAYNSEIAKYQADVAYEKGRANDTAYEYERLRTEVYGHRRSIMSIIHSIIFKIKHVILMIPGVKFIQKIVRKLRKLGISGIIESLRDRKFYHNNFSDKILSPKKFASMHILKTQLKNQPSDKKISVVVPLYNTDEKMLREMIESVKFQTYTNWELCLADASTDNRPEQYVKSVMTGEPRIKYKRLAENEGIAGNTNRAIEMATGEYISLLDHDDVLSPCALFYVAKAIEKQKADFIYTDEVTFEGDFERYTCFNFKPDFAIDNLRANNYICHLSTFKKTLLDECGGGERNEYNGSQDYDLILRLTEKAKSIVHIPYLLYYWRSSAASVASDISAKPYCLTAAVKALDDHYKRLGIDAKAKIIEGTPGYYKTYYAIKWEPLISIIIPNKDHSVDLEKCIKSIYTKSTYSNFEIIIVENNSTNYDTFELYKNLKKKYDNLSVVVWKGKTFNYSAINNFAVKKAKGEMLLFLNNDVEVITENWMEEMLMFAQQQRVGCVGVKLLYSDATIQHAGIALGFLGLAAHIHRNVDAQNAGYMGRLSFAQDIAAVTAACMMVRKDVFESVDGFDESFEVAFNDFDLCMRIWKAGYQNIFTPFAQLFHYESKSRGTDEKPVKHKRFMHEVKFCQLRWKKEIEAGDPFMNPNIDHNSEVFEFKFVPFK